LLVHRDDGEQRVMSMKIGDPVEVHTKFDQSWCAGFEIAAITDGGYRVRRTSDGELLPNITSHSDLRAADRPDRER
jgi:hypothetical protein